MHTLLNRCCRLIAVLLPLMFMNPVPVVARDASDEAVALLNAYADYKAGDYPQAHAQWLKLAKQGSTTAMNNLANMYDQGQGVERDPRKAVSWLRKAAGLGDRVAQLNLGLAYEDGRGVKQDNREAARWFRKSAVQGDPDAQLNLGVMLATNYGRGAQTSSAGQRREAVEWLSKAADQGNAQAPMFLELLQGE